MKGYELKITLAGSKPPIWRKVIVPSTINFKTLHHIIQISMGWLDYHMHEFEFKKLNLCIGEKDSEMDDGWDDREGKSEKTKIAKLLEQEKVCTYSYDFGDDWIHKVELIAIHEDYKNDYAIVTKAKGNCPPEDCGGIWGYEEFLEKISDPKNEEYEEIKEWAQEQGYGDYDIEEVNEELKAKEF